LDKRTHPRNTLCIEKAMITERMTLRWPRRVPGDCRPRRMEKTLDEKLNVEAWAPIQQSTGLALDQDMWLLGDCIFFADFVLVDLICTCFYRDANHPRGAHLDFIVHSPCTILNSCLAELSLFAHVSNGKSSIGDSMKTPSIDMVFQPAIRGRLIAVQVR
jgi:hypothetical protein